MSARLPVRVHRSPRVIAQPLDGELVLLNPDSEDYYSLDSVGSRLWELLDESSPLEQVVTALLAEYAVDEATLRSDLARLLDEMAQAGLIVLEP